MGNNLNQTGSYISVRNVQGGRGNALRYLNFNVAKKGAKNRERELKTT